MSARDMVDKVTGWLEDTASLKSETLLELVDSIRDELGSDISGQFSGTVKPALEELYNTLETTRTTLAQAVAILTGEEGPTGPAGAPEMGVPGEEEFPGGDEFAAKVTEDADTLIRILNTLKSRADSKGTPAQYSWDAVSNMLSNVSGTQMDYDTFKKEFDTIPQLKNIVAQFDGRGLTLKTKEKPEATNSQPNSAGGLDASAKRAAAKSLKQPG
jgi:hypothetical protein